MGVGLAIGVPLAIIVIAELGRTLVARVFSADLERYPFGMMKLPGVRGTTGFRLTLILAGPVVAYLAIAGLALGYYGSYGLPAVTNKVESTAAGYAAATKVAVDDVIAEVDGKPFAGGAPELSRLVNAQQGAPITLTIERDGKRLPIIIEPKQVENRWILGVTLQHSIKDNGLALRHAITYPISQGSTILGGLLDVVRGKEAADPGGPVKIIHEFTRAADRGADSALGLSMLFGVYALLVLVAFDFVRALFLLLFRS